jgi:hypothetical protein
MTLIVATSLVPLSTTHNQVDLKSTSLRCLKENLTNHSLLHRYKHNLFQAMGASTLVHNKCASTHLTQDIKIHQDIRSQSTLLIQNNTDLDQTLDTSVLITQDTNLQDSTNTGQDLLSINQDSLSISRDHPSSSINQGLNIILRI